MGERKCKASSTSARSSRHKTTSSTSSKSSLTALLQGATTVGNVKLVRHSSNTLFRLRHLNEAEIITLFTPFVPHPPSTTLAKNMDPFEPLGRALPRKVRHVPYRLDNGMTETHTNFLPASGAIVVVICATDNITRRNTQAFQQQVKFARDICSKVAEDHTITNNPVIMILVSDDNTIQAHASILSDFTTIVAINDYSAAALLNAVHCLFSK